MTVSTKLSSSTRYGLVALCLVIALMAGAASALGVFARGDGSTSSTTSIRGERYEYTTTGVYAYNSERVVAEGVGWDIFTLFFAVPALLLTLPWLAKGSLRGRLIAAGLLGYLFYQYLMYAMAWAFGPLLVLFIAVYGASLAGIVWIFSTISLPTLAEGVSERFPRRSMAALCFVMSAVLLLMWGQRIAAGYQGDWATAMLAGETTMVVQALDLGLIVPLLVFTGVTVLRRRPVGYLLSSVLVVKAVAMASAIAAMLVSAALVEGHLEIGSFAIFGGAALASMWIAYRIYATIAPRAEPLETETTTDGARGSASEQPLGRPAGRTAS